MRGSGFIVLAFLLASPARAAAQDAAVAPAADTPRAFFAISVADLEALRERKVPFAFGPFPANGAQRANVAIRDNAGNLLQFFGR